MPGVVDSNGPNYISSHSADVILSDIRPIKLKADALRAINVLLDEFLHSILATSRSLATEKLRASLLSILPTSLGKEALLEAEVELRAYWERTNSREQVVDDSRTFHLQWSFELLRLKCEAYSTLNEEDDDSSAEARVNEKFASVHSHPPKSSLVDPAALYLTAILEAMCEHILSNVGRVAARDSSRTYATVNDLFVALCEDDSIYGLFRMMKVYEQIELMSKTPKSRRSKSFTRNDRSSISRTSSPQLDSQSVSQTSSRTRQSSEGQSTIVMPPSTSGSRTSFDKARGMRIFGNKGSEGDTVSGHRKSDSMKSEASRYPDDEPLTPTEDAAMLREFDDLMRSASTMKVSLTPDRLKTMEVYKQEKDLFLKGRRHGGHFPSNSTPDVLPAANQQSNRQVDSITEDEEEANTPKGRARQASVATLPAASLSGASTRARSVSTSSGVNPVRKPVRAPTSKAAPSAFSHAAPTVDMVQSRTQKAPDTNGFPARTRTRGLHRDSLDLDDVMNGSDDERDTTLRSRGHSKTPTTPTSPKSMGGPKGAHVSARTRELIDFLAEGPPETPMSKNGRDLVDFLSQEPSNYASSAVSLEGSKSQKGGGRLQRMISKLNLGNAEKARGGPDAPKTPTASKHYTTPDRPIHPKASVGTLSSLANRPIPPRPPRPISPPSSVPSHDSSDENKAIRSPPRKPHVQTTSSELLATDKPPLEVPAPIATSFSAPPAPLHREYQSQPIKEKPVHTRPPPPAFVHGNGPINGHVKPTNVAPSKPQEAIVADAQPIVSPRKISTSSTISRKPVPAISTTYAPSITEPDLRDMQRLMENASTADECRIILDMYMARSGISREPKPQAVPYPSPSPSVVKHTPYTDSENSLESSLVELLLGASPYSTLPSEQPEVPTSDGEATPVDGLPTAGADGFPPGLEHQKTHITHNTSHTQMVSIRA